MMKADMLVVISAFVLVGVVEANDLAVTNESLNSSSVLTVPDSNELIRTGFVRQEDMSFVNDKVSIKDMKTLLHFKDSDLHWLVSETPRVTRLFSLQLKNASCELEGPIARTNDATYMVRASISYTTDKKPPADSVLTVPDTNVLIQAGFVLREDKGYLNENISMLDMKNLFHFKNKDLEQLPSSSPLGIYRLTLRNGFCTVDTTVKGTNDATRMVRVFVMHSINLPPPKKAKFVVDHLGGKPSVAPEE